MCGAGAGGDEEEDMVGAGCRVMKTDPEREVGRGGEVDVENEGVRSRVPGSGVCGCAAGCQRQKRLGPLGVGGVDGCLACLFCFGVMMA